MIKTTQNEKGEFIQVDMSQEEMANLPKISYNYDQLVEEFIREKYTLGDELSLNSKSMSIFLHTCTQEEKIRWTEQLKEFTAYRIECIRRAKEMCNMI